MPDAPKSPSEVLGAAQGYLRETAKWLVGGVVATAAGVFAGSSLTKLGALDPFVETGRLGVALGGVVIGFAGLAWLLSHAIAVLTIESVTFRQLAAAESSTADQDTALRAVALEIAKKYQKSMPPGITTLEGFVVEIDKRPINQQLDNDARKFDRLVMPDAGFLSVRNRFRILTKTLPKATGLAILGFGLFAWAANPPDKPSKPESGITLKITH